MTDGDVGADERKDDDYTLRNELEMRISTQKR